MKITKKQHAELPAWLQASFTVVDGDADSYDNGEHDEDVTGLQTALATERRLRKTAEKEAKAAKAAKDLEDDDGDDGDGKPDKGGKDKTARERARIQKEADDRVAAVLDKSGKALVKAEQEKLAAKLFVNPDRDAIHLSSRIGYEIVDGEAVLVVKDKAGNTMEGKTVDSLRKEMLADKQYSGIVVASRASGGGAATTRDNGNQTGSQDDSKSEKEMPDISKLSGKEIVKAMREAGKAPSTEAATEE